MTASKTFWSGTSDLQQDNDALFAALVPPMGPALTPHGELLRATTRIYYDRYNNGFGNGPFEHEMSVIEKAAPGMIEAGHLARSDFTAFEIAFRSTGLGERSLHGADWEGDKPMEQLLRAVVRYAKEVDARVPAADRAPANSMSDLLHTIKTASADDREEAISFLVKYMERASAVDDELLSKLTLAQPIALAPAARPPRP